MKHYQKNCLNEILPLINWRKKLLTSKVSSPMWKKSPALLAPSSRTRTFLYTHPCAAQRGHVLNQIQISWFQKRQKLTGAVKVPEVLVHCMKNPINSVLMTGHLSLHMKLPFSMLNPLTHCQIWVKRIWISSLMSIYLEILMTFLKLVFVSMSPTKRYPWNFAQHAQPWHKQIGRQK